MQLNFLSHIALYCNTFRGGFRGVSLWKPLRIFPRRWVRSFSATTFHKAYTVGWIAVLTGLCFNSNLKKFSEDLFFWSPRRKIGDLRKNCVVASLETLREDPTVRIRDKQAAWKLLSKISRTAPEYLQATSLIQIKL